MSLHRWVRDDAGFALTLVLITSILVGLIGVGVLSVVTSDLHGAVANQLAMQVLNVAEAGVDYEVSVLYAKLLEAPTDCAEGYTNEQCWSGPDEGAFGERRFQVVVRCLDGSTPSATGCATDNDFRRIVSTGTVGRARRRIEALVSRSPSGGSGPGAFCGQAGVTLDQGTTIMADVGSGEDISVEGPRRNPGTIDAREVPSPNPAAFTLNGIDRSALGLRGTYSWKITFVDAAGVESNGSPQTSSVTLSDQSGLLSSIPLGGATIQKRRVYRTRAGTDISGPWFFVGEIPDNTAVEYRDTKPDGELIFRLPTSPDPPVPSIAPTAGVEAPPVPPGLMGSYTYKVTFVYRYPGSTLAEVESLASNPASPSPVALNLTDEYVKLTSIPQTTDPTVLKRRIYRTRADQATTGPWLFVAEIASSNDDLDDLDPSPAVERGYVDKKADAELKYPTPRPISGNAFAAGSVFCSQGCATQVDGEVRQGAREVVCPVVILPPCTPDSNPNNDAPMTITQTESDPVVMELRYDEMHPGAGQRMTINTPNNLGAELHIHVRSVTFERDAILAISGKGTVYFHVADTFRLGQRSWFGIDDNKPGSLLVWPGARVKILSCANDDPGESSVSWDQQNRVAALVIAPKANIQVNQAGEFTGGLLGQSIHIHQGLGYVLDPGSGIAGGGVKLPYQIIERWYDNPRF